MASESKKKTCRSCACLLVENTFMINKQKLVKPTKEELANGWTEQTLNAYINNRDIAQSRYIMNDNQERGVVRPTVQNKRR